ncbi:signal peptidase I [Nocardiopsis tropica]|jgi:signal peptidase I|uniref:Signal peptidase I n=1 Tax=Nocardiopsis tropica TaxID=109330 RepID=A0ABU7KPZ8_9ACTN|nr:signal peptidase I [Nocardiopsis umidischolae]MEE2051373.1 signal peptidase I [Nocardiopsis umidischolae]
MSKDERDPGADGVQDEDSARPGPEERSSATGSRVPEDSGASGVSEVVGQEPEEKADAEMSKSQSSEKKGSFWKELPILIVIAVVLAFVIRTWVMQAFYIPSTSMENTLLVGDRVLVNKVVYQIRDIERGEVVVFNGNGSWDDPNTVTVPEPTNPVAGAFSWVQQQLGAAPTGKEYIKRVIGLPGDTVECCDEQNRILVNGVPLDEDAYLYPGSVASHTEFGPVEVPEGHLWLMGDHRAISYDSRLNQNNPGGGAVPIDHVVGRAFVIIWPFNQVGGLGVPESFEAVDAAAG